MDPKLCKKIVEFYTYQDVGVVLLWYNQHTYRETKWRKVAT